MKQIVIILFIMLQSVVFAEDVSFSQNEILKRLIPILKKAESYEKYQEIMARKAVTGESIKTITSDGLETKNTAKAGDYVVKNTTEVNEMYIVKKEKFDQRYEYIKDLDHRWASYKAIGTIKAIEVDKKLIINLGTEKEFFFIAPWGEKMIVKKGDYLVSPLDYSEVYRIAKKEFFETYRRQKK